MFDLVGYAASTQGVKIVGDPDDLQGWMPGEIEDESFLQIRGSYARAMDRGWEWVMGESARLQPAFHAAVAASNPRLVTVLRAVDDPFGRGTRYPCALLVVGDGLAFRVEPEAGNRQDDAPGHASGMWSGLFRSLPPAIAESYFQHADGMDLVEDGFLFNLHPRGLPFGLSRAMSAIDYAQPAGRDKKKQAREILASMLEVRATGEVGDASDFVVLLDTRRHGDESRDGDLLVYQRFDPSRRVFWAPQMDLGRIRRLEDPVAAMDVYCAQALRADRQTFDFAPYASAP